jgi:hypothetical protein
MKYNDFIEIERKHLERESRESKELMNQILADDFEEFGVDGIYLVKTDIMNRVPLKTIANYRIEKFKVIEEGTVRVKTDYTLIVQDSSGQDGYTMYCQSTWVYRDNDWKLREFRFRY